MSIDRTRLHYETLLAPVYRWMLGDFEAALDQARRELGDLGVTAARGPARALDLGAGLGLHAIPLTALGYAVTAVDSSAALLAELAAACPGARVVHADLAELAQRPEVVADRYEVVLCMGDTLPHLRTAAEVSALLATASACVAPGGRVLLGFRDYSGPPRVSTSRFIPVRSDADRILTCCLDYADDHVRVTDLVHERRGDGWTMRASEYAKLRLAPAAVAAELAAHGLTIERCEPTGRGVVVTARSARGSG